MRHYDSNSNGKLAFCDSDIPRKFRGRFRKKSEDAPRGRRGHAATTDRVNDSEHAKRERNFEERRRLPPTLPRATLKHLLRADRTKT